MTPPYRLPIRLSHLRLFSTSYLPTLTQTSTSTSTSTILKQQTTPFTNPIRTYHHTTTLKMRLPYVPNPPPTSTPEDQAIVDRITERRAPRPLQPLDLTLLHSPPVADGWNAFLGAVRTRTLVPADARELAISRVAVVNKAWYEWAHHAPLAVAAGVSEAAMEFVRTAAAAALSDVRAAGADRGGLDERLWAVLCLADEMTRNVEVREETFAVVRGLFGERGVVELVATVACYNCVSRFLVAMDVGEKNGTGPDAAH
ncbi:hypothetical protein VM1G_08491 [Cytospora mali]|uniref:Carboxymuconolactone decarboxylase-like domain-containing protein n=1 Tax=Cytospora mali TaxID=578113 RepID=A0A194W8B3_CYTMA|nr:hypothetical protein VM1G_08491 [Valsa mali]